MFHHIHGLFQNIFLENVHQKLGLQKPHPPPLWWGQHLNFFRKSEMKGSERGAWKKFFCSYVPCVSTSHFSCEGKKCGNDFEKRWRISFEIMLPLRNDKSARQRNDTPRTCVHVGIERNEGFWKPFSHDRLFARFAQLQSASWGSQQGLALSN